MTLPSLWFEHHSQLQQILTTTQEDSFDLSDLLIGLHYQANNHLPVMTFDKKASKSEWFKLLD